VIDKCTSSKVNRYTTNKSRAKLLIFYDINDHHQKSLLLIDQHRFSFFFFLFVDSMNPAAG